MHPKQAVQASPKVTLQITCDLAVALSGGDGCEVTGPIKNKAVCYMVLELARDKIKAFADEAATKRIVDPTAGPFTTAPTGG